MNPVCRRAILGGVTAPGHSAVSDSECDHESSLQESDFGLHEGPTWLSPEMCTEDFGVGFGEGGVELLQLEASVGEGCSYFRTGDGHDEPSVGERAHSFTGLPAPSALHGQAPAKRNGVRR